MRLPPRLLAATFLTLGSLMSVPAFADDALKVDGLKYTDEVTVIGIKNGQLQALVKSNEKLFDLAKVDSITLANQTEFNQAEDSRKDAKKSAALYKKAVQNINDRKLKVVAELRAVGPTDADGKWTEAVMYFVDVYQASPTDSVWKLKPTNMPPATSNMLKQSADHIQGKLASFSSDGAKKNLKVWELEMLTKANDPRAAALAKELGLGVVEPAANTAVPSGPATPTAATPPEAPAPVAGEGFEGVTNALNAKRYDEAITRADAMLKISTGDTAIRLFELQAQAYEGKQALAEAAATYLRIPAHYPSSAAAPTALLRAADLQKQLKHVDEAKRLYKEIVDSYPNSAAAVKAKGQI